MISSDRPDARERAAERRALVPWYADLGRGTGEAAALDPAVRVVLLRAPARAAEAEGARVEAAGREAASAITAARRLEESEAPPSAWAHDRHDPRRAVSVLLRMLAISVPVWLLTPIIASFGTAVVPQLMGAVFVANEHGGRASGDVPFVLYAHLAVTLLLSCAATFAINVIFGIRARFLWLLALYGIAGFSAAASMLMTGDGAMWLWDITPGSLVLGYLISQIATTAADRDHGRRRS